MTNNTSPLDIMMIGHFARDLLVVDGQAEYASGGGVYYGGIAAQRLGASVGVVTRLRSEDFPYLQEMTEAGLEVFATPAPATSGIENRYHSADMERRECSLMNFAGPFQPAEIPARPARITAIVLIIAGEVDLPLLQLLASRGPVALDIQGFVRVPRGRDLVFEQWPDMLEGLQSVTYLKVDRAEAELLTGLTDMPAAARQLSALGPQEIVLTQSSGVTIYAAGQLYHAPFTPRSLAGRTGRGDTCFATYLSKRLTSSPEVATKWAGIVTSLKQETPGPWLGSVEEVEGLIMPLSQNRPQGL
jgi:sugar/nucleoside kinase (ribokinase family)